VCVDVSRRFGAGSSFENPTDTHGKQRPYISLYNMFNPLTPELNPSAQRCLTIFTVDFAS
jgi:hypothetical protein